MNPDHYDDCRRLISILSGRVSVGDLLRGMICEMDYLLQGPDSKGLIINPQQASSVALGIFIEPCYYPSPTKAYLDVLVKDRIVLFHLALDITPFKTHY